MFYDTLLRCFNFATFVRSFEALYQIDEEEKLDFLY